MAPISRSNGTAGSAAPRPQTPNLVDFYRHEILPRLTADQVYTHPAHNWRRSADKWRGACPWHTSESGSSFNVTLSNLLFFCPGCDVGGDPIQYLYRLRGGHGAPRGQDFIDILRELAGQAGVSLPEKKLTPEEQAAAEAQAEKRAALELVYRHCQSVLWSDRGELARAYLLERGLGDEAVRDLELGLYPPLAELRAVLRAAGFRMTVNEGLWGGLVGYVTFPWREEYGHPLTLYGRWPGSDLPNAEAPKTTALPGEGSKQSPLYFDRVRKAHKDEPVMVEGLFDAAVAQAHGHVEVVAYVGAQPSLAQLATLKRHGIKAATICPDPDAAGNKGILSFLRNLDGSIRAYVAPELPDHTDPDQYILGHGIDAWREHIARAVRGPIYRSGAILRDHDLETAKGRDAALENLKAYASTLHGRDLDDVTALVAEPLRIAATTLRAELEQTSERRNGHITPVALHRGGGGDSQGEGHAAETGHAVLDEIHAFLGRFVAYPSAHAHIAHVLWIVHTHLMAAWESTPRIAFLSPEPGSGKTRALEVSELLVPRPVEAVNVTPAYLFRKVGDPKGAPTILYDEIDTVFGPKAKDNEEIRGLLNAGHRRGAVAGRCVVKGKQVETEEIPAYCAVALAGLGGLPDTILSRAVVVRMRRRAPGERVQAYRRRVHASDGHRIRDRLAAWARTVEATVSDAWPEMPAGIEDRDADIWEPLLAVADAAGGEWPGRARCSAVALVAASKESTPSLGVRLLADLRLVFGDKAAMSTEDIVTALNGLEEAPWSEIVSGKPLNALGLAQRLRQFSISSKNIRNGDKVCKGYSAEDLSDAWARYLPQAPRQKGATSATDDASPPGQHVSDDLEKPLTESATAATDPDIDLCATCGVNPVEMFGLDCDECMGMVS